MAMILSPDEWVTDLGIDRERFEAEAQKRWPDGTLIEVTDPEANHDVTMQIRPPGERPFQIFHTTDGAVISTDGDDDQAADVALWVASLLPENPGGRIWFCDQHFTGHVELHGDITLEGLRDGWVDHEDEPPVFGEAVEK
jgi:hypothetical protein